MKLLPPADMVQTRKRPREAAGNSDSESDLRGVKKQARYVPKTEVKMTKEELSAWRKEARRLRNRESAAASRRKTRETIQELQSQVNALQAKYEQALARIAELESSSDNKNESQVASNSSWSPEADKTSQDDKDSTPCSSPRHTVSPSVSPIPHEFGRQDMLLPSSCHQQYLSQLPQLQQHMPMFSQSTAVKTTHDAANVATAEIKVEDDSTTTTVQPLPLTEQGVLESTSNESFVVPPIKLPVEPECSLGDWMNGEDDDELNQFLSEAFMEA